VDLSDSVAVLRHLYGGVRLLPEPFLVCGREVTGDSLGCDEHRGCE
jgi:hypothetical protein